MMALRGAASVNVPAEGQLKGVLHRRGLPTSNVLQDQWRRGRRLVLVDRAFYAEHADRGALQRQHERQQPHHEQTCGACG